MHRQTGRESERERDREREREMKDILFDKAKKHNHGTYP